MDTWARRRDRNAKKALAPGHRGQRFSPQQPHGNALYDKQFSNNVLIGNDNGSDAASLFVRKAALPEAFRKQLHQKLSPAFPVLFTGNGLTSVPFGRMLYPVQYQNARTRSMEAA
ncbi:hypothetical protein [Komagataeibacter xylinus]|uniref:hypothetical protein n=1 Tax=Komagataeibacter xylinus TaxID=28448 RepID=UPI001030DF91|nr:hypothetical protein [Komagataeibacter xylinus]